MAESKQWHISTSFTSIDPWTQDTCHIFSDTTLKLFASWQMQTKSWGTSHFEGEMVSQIVRLSSKYTVEFWQYGT